jgi:hypothetical protein
MDSITPYQPMALRRALSKARNVGWHVVEGNLCELARALNDERGNRPVFAPLVRLVRGRSSDDDVQVLRPTTTQMSSKSGRFGPRAHSNCSPTPQSSQSRACRRRQRWRTAITCFGAASR